MYHRTHRRHRHARFLEAVLVGAVGSALPIVATEAPAGAQSTSGVIVTGPLDAADENEDAVFTIRAIAPPAPAAITLQFSTFDPGLPMPGIATPNSDYEPVANRPITLSPQNAYQATTSVRILDDGAAEPIELIIGQIHTVSANSNRLVPVAMGILAPSDVPLPTVTVPTIPPVTVPSIPPVTVPKVPSLGPLAEIPRFAINDVVQAEGTGGSTTFRFTVQRSGNAFVPATVKFETVDGSAVAGQDYQAQEGSLHFTAGEQSESIDVPVLSDRRVENDESFTVSLSNPSLGSGISDEAGTGTILDDDAPPVPPVGTTPKPPSHHLTTPDGGGYWLHDWSGQIRPFGNAPAVGDLTQLLAPAVAQGLRVVGMSAHPRQPGAWVADNRGGVYTLGSASFYGSMPGLLAAGRINGLPEIADIAALPTGDGYTLLSREGGVFTFGNARFFGSLHSLVEQGRLTVVPEAVSMAYTPSGNGYWVVSADGGVFTFGDAAFHGSVPGLVAQKRIASAPRIVEIAPVSGGKGYALVDQLGGVYTFGEAPFHGSLPGLAAAGILKAPVRVLAADYTPTSDGFWIFGRTGGVFTFGAAKFFGAAQWADDPPPQAGAQAKARRASRRRR